MKRLIQGVLRHFGYAITQIVAPNRIVPDDFQAHEADIIKLVLPYTMTSTERLQALISATNYVIDANIPGAIVECGVWR